MSLNTGRLYELIQTNQLKPIRRSQKNVGYNYFFTQNLPLTLFNPKIISIKDTYIVLQFEKRDSLELLKMLRNISESLYELIRSNWNMTSTSTYYPIHSEQETTFSIRCSLNRSKCTSVFDNEVVNFSLPRVGVTLKAVTAEIKNIWESGSKLGFNIELKSIEN